MHKAEDLGEDTIEDIMSCLCPCRRLAFNVIMRATRDAIETCTLSSIERADAGNWILSSSNRVFGAVWWAESANLEGILELCRKLVRKGKNAEQSLPRNRSGSLRGVRGNKKYWGGRASRIVPGQEDLDRLAKVRSYSFGSR